MKKFILITVMVLSLHCKDTGVPFDRSMSFASSVKDGILPYFKGNNLDPVWPEKENMPADLRGLNDISLKNQNEETVTALNLKGKYVIAAFFFASCVGICPMITLNMKKVSSEIDNQSDLVFISITVDPERDSPGVLRKYIREQKINQSNWHFLTGEKSSIYSLARTQFNADVAVNEKDDLRDFVHSENIYLLDKSLLLRGMYRGRGYADLKRLIKDLKLLRKNNG